MAILSFTNNINKPHPLYQCRIYPTTHAFDLGTPS